jgi:Zn ribbon nucleic-acid-binding protein
MHGAPGVGTAYIRVDLLPLGTAYFQLCDADLADDGTGTTLEVTADNGRMKVATLRKGQWKEANAFDATDHPLYWFRPKFNIVPVCAWCPNRAEQEALVRAAGDDVTHTICSKCSERERLKDEALRRRHSR